jgi:hypothetical protein
MGFEEIKIVLMASIAIIGALLFGCLIGFNLKDKS